MKKGRKILLTISGICGGAGLILLVAGLLLGISTAQFWDALSLDFGELLGWGNSSQKIQKELENLGDLSDPGALPSNWETTGFPGVKSLSMDMDGGAVRMVFYEGGQIQVCTQKDDSRTEMEMDGSRLEIVQKDRKIFRQAGKTIIIYVPENYQFEDVDVDLGATDFRADGMKAREISAQIGAGVLQIEGRIVARSSSWEVDMGVLELGVVDSENFQIETGMGTAKATLQGSQQDYELEGELGMGSLNFGDSRQSTPGTFKINEGAGRLAEVSCGMGKVDINFTE